MNTLLKYTKKITLIGLLALTVACANTNDERYIQADSSAYAYSNDAMYGIGDRY